MPTPLASQIQDVLPRNRGCLLQARVGGWACPHRENRHADRACGSAQLASTQCQSPPFRAAPRFDASPKSHPRREYPALLLDFTKTSLLRDEFGANRWKLLT